MPKAYNGNNTKKQGKNYKFLPCFFVALYRPVCPIGHIVYLWTWTVTVSGLFGTPWGIRTPGLLVRRLSHAQIGVVSAPICAFYHHSLGGSSIVSVQPCPLFSDSGSKLGQAQSSRIPLTSRAELIYDWARKSGQKTVRTFLIYSKMTVELFTSFMV